MTAHQAAQLRDIKILDLTSVIMGPVCTQILAGYGAEVIKVEPPEGDIMRHAGAKAEFGMGAMFLHSNRGKKSVVVDLKSELGRQQVAELLLDCDVLVHNIRTAAIARLGLDAETVMRVRPDIVYAELTGYGVGGPYSERPAFDDVIQAEAGLSSLFSRQTGGDPAYLPALIADRLTGVTAAHRILAALFERERTGKGSYLNVAMFETMAEFVLADHLGERTFNFSEGATGYNRLLTKHRRPYATSDGHIAVIVYNDKHWKSFFDVIGRPETFAMDERFRTAAKRADSYDYIYEFVSRVIAERSTSEWLEVLRRAEIPCAPVNSVESLLEDTHLQQVGFFESHARTHGREWAASPLPGIRSALAPHLGEHSDVYLSTELHVKSEKNAV
ncbi:CoA transferase [Comamonas aquatica]|nr:CoA transferase [Comamonas aquatica]